MRSGVESLSARERETVRLLGSTLGDGTAAWVAAQMGIAVPTVKRYLTKAYDKLGVCKAPQATQMVAEYDTWQYAVRAFALAAKEGSDGT